MSSPRRVTAPASKSLSHRYCIGAALAAGESRLRQQPVIVGNETDPPFRHHTADFPRMRFALIAAHEAAHGVGELRRFLAALGYLHVRGRDSKGCRGNLKVLLKEDGAFLRGSGDDGGILAYILGGSGKPCAVLIIANLGALEGRAAELIALAVDNGVRPADGELVVRSASAGNGELELGEGATIIARGDYSLLTGEANSGYLAGVVNGNGVRVAGSIGNLENYRIGITIKGQHLDGVVAYLSFIAERILGGFFRQKFIPRLFKLHR